MKLILLTAVLLLSVTACREKSKCGDVRCTPVGMNLMFQGYATDTAYLNTYTPNGQFNNMLTSKTLTGEDIYTPEDMYFEENRKIVKDFLMVQGVDYELILPATSDTFRIWNIRNSPDTLTYTCNPSRAGCSAFAKDGKASGGKWEVVQTYNISPTNYSVLFYK